jgi:hypothetical protein
VKRLIVLGLLAAAVLAGAAPAATVPAGRYSGPTGQTGKSLSLVVSSVHRVTLVSIAYKASCSSGPDFFGSVTAHTYAPIRSDGTVSFFTHASGVALEFHGKFAGARWTGTFEVHRDSGNCDSSTVPWGAHRSVPVPVRKTPPPPPKPVPGPAVAGRYSGPTSQTGKSLSFTVSAAKRVTSVVIDYKASCTSGPDYFGRISVSPNVAIGSDGSFSYYVKNAGVGLELHGKFDNTHVKATGTFEVHKDDGNCDTSTVTWGAHL